jgi:hypothetical protein
MMMVTPRRIACRDRFEVRNKPGFRALIRAAAPGESGSRLRA